MFFATRFLSSPGAIVASIGFICIVSISFIFRLYFNDPTDLFQVFRPSSAAERITIPSWPYVQVVDDEPSDLDDSTLWPYRVFKSASSWHPPYFTVDIYNDTNLADGYLFFNLTNRSMTCAKQSAPFIMDPVGNELVYGFDQPTGGTIGFRVQHLGGEPYATFWRGETVLGHGYGEVVLLDGSYRETIVQLDSALPFEMNIMPERHAPGPIDFHEHAATSRNSIIVTAYNNTRMDLSHLGGPEDG